MRKGVHTIRSGITSADNPAQGRRYSLDNGDFEVNMKITDLEIFPCSTNPADLEDLATTAVFFCIATTNEGSIPTATTASPEEYGAVLNLRPSDNRQIAWGILSPAYGYVYTLVDPDHIIPEDLYVNAWSISSGGSINPVPYTVGFLIRMQQVKNTGNEALLYQVRETLDES